MNYKMVGRIVGSVLCLETLFMAPGLFLCLYDGETDVALAYALAAIPTVGVLGIWWSVPIGWLLADAVGLGWYFLRCRRTLSP